MRLPAATLAIFSLTASAEAQPRPAPQRVAPPIVHEITPALGDYTDAVLFGDLWQRADLAPRDRSIVTIAALIAGGHTGQMTGHFNRALDNGVKPGEIAAIITHLAFYAGWPRAISAVSVAKDVFTQRKVAPELSASAPLPVDAAGEAQRAAAVQSQVGDVAPALAAYTNGVLFGDLWRRADLAPRDRSLATIAALIAAGQADQLPFHMNRGMNSGLTQVQITEAITHLAFYAGWPRAMSAVPVAKAVFEARAATPRKAAIAVLRGGSQPTGAGAAANFTGAVRIDSRFQQTAPARVGGGIVSFEPGAHTAWHTHPLGQTLVVTAGCGLVQREGDAVQEIRAGDIVWIPPGEKHWHGAAPTTGMTHIAISEVLDGKSVEWLEKLTAEQYPRAAGGQPRC